MPTIDNKTPKKMTWSTYVGRTRLDVHRFLSVNRLDTHERLVEWCGLHNIVPPVEPLPEHAIHVNASPRPPRQKRHPMPVECVVSVSDIEPVVLEPVLEPALVVDVETVQVTQHDGPADSDANVCDSDANDVEFGTTLRVSRSRRPKKQNL